MSRFVLLGVVVGFVVALLVLREPDAARAPVAAPPPSRDVERMKAAAPQLQGKFALNQRAQLPTPVDEPLRGPDAGAWVVGPR